VSSFFDRLRNVFYADGQEQVERGEVSEQLKEIRSQRATADRAIDEIQGAAERMARELQMGPDPAAALRRAQIARDEGMRP
jgi:hypothetical protein